MKENKKICNKEKKIVFFDIDDTLYTPETGVPDTAVKAIKQLRENGHMAFISTGRTKAMIYRSMLDIGFDGIIAGAGTYGEYNGQVLFRYDMKSDDVKDALEMLRHFGFIPVPEGHDYLYYEDEGKWSKEYETLFNKYSSHISDSMRKIPEDAEDICIGKTSAIFTKDSRFHEAEKYFEARYTVVNHKNHLLELIPKGFSKADGIRKVITGLGIPRENTYAFGDSMNDYEMLSYVNNSVAMGNSDKRILALAKHVTDTVGNDGIYKGLKSLGLI